MTDATTTEAPAKPRPKRKAKRRYVRKASPPPGSPSGPKDEFAGLTASACCAACSAQMCLISGNNICAHPLKGGLQASMMQNRPALERFNRAKKKLAHAKIDLTKI